MVSTHLCSWLPQSRPWMLTFVSSLRHHMPSWSWETPPEYPVGAWKYLQNSKWPLLTQTILPPCWLQGQHSCFRKSRQTHQASLYCLSISLYSALLLGLQLGSRPHCTPYNYKCHPSSSFLCPCQDFRQSFLVVLAFSCLQWFVPTPSGNLSSLLSIPLALNQLGLILNLFFVSILKGSGNYF